MRHGFPRVRQGAAPESAALERWAAAGVNSGVTRVKVAVGQCEGWMPKNIKKATKAVERMEF